MQVSSAQIEWIRRQFGIIKQIADSRGDHYSISYEAERAIKYMEQNIT